MTICDINQRDILWFLIGINMVVGLWISYNSWRLSQLNKEFEAHYRKYLESARNSSFGGKVRSGD